ncbi:MAG: hypothetical protein M0Q24_05060 [Sulfurimonas sp.]|uniref:hypothetical protein n=1 Tax=Sulfurimonas sp. TaxID=2022749 RepID=UPI0025F02319|nr:hypothetical protein [Sulfurimonas sp.]MCK9491440.1 hypothetical protein [Sulfurimonas sp.]
MKNNLGKVFLVLLLLLSLELFASTYEWSVQANKKSAMTNEPIHLKYTCTFSDTAQTYAIEFKPVVDNDEYRVLLLSENESIVDEKRINTYEYLLYVKKAQDLKLFFDTTMKKTNKDSIRNSVIGRDNAEYEDYSIRIIRQEGVELEIKDARSELVGKISADVKKDKSNIMAYQPYHLEIKIEGLVNYEAIKAFHFDIDGVKVIEEKPIKEVSLTKDGHIGLWSQKFAFVSDKNFTIPKIEIDYFDLEDKKVRTLSFDKVEVEVKELYKKEELLEKKTKKFEIEYEYFYYALTFLAGFLFAKIKFKKRVKLSSLQMEFNKKIDDAKTLEELVFLLVLSDAKGYDKIIKMIEQKEIESLKNAKEVSKFKVS